MAAGFYDLLALFGWKSAGTIGTLECVEAEVYLAGAKEAEVYLAGAAEAEVYLPGAVEAEVTG